MSKHQPREKLSPKQLAFVDRVVAHPELSLASAATHAGYDPSAGSRLYNHPTIAAEIEKRRANLRKETDYDVKAAMREAEEAMDFSRQTRNANAYVKAVELRSKLMGLLVEKMDVRQLTNFRINILGMPGGGDPMGAASPLVNVDGIANVPMALNPAREVSGDEGATTTIDDAQFEPPNPTAIEIQERQAEKALVYGKDAGVVGVSEIAVEDIFGF